MIERIAVSDALTILAHPAFAMLVWHNGPTIESVAGIERLIADYERKAERVDIVAVVLPVGDYPDDEARKRLAESMRSPILNRFAIINAGKGFKASIVRSIISGITLLTRSAGPTKVFSSLEDAAEWLLQDPRPYALADLQAAYSRVDTTSRAAD